MVRRCPKIELNLVEWGGEHPMNYRSDTIGDKSTSVNPSKSSTNWTSSRIWFAVSSHSRKHPEISVNPSVSCLFVCGEFQWATRTVSDDSDLTDLVVRRFLSTSGLGKSRQDGLSIERETEAQRVRSTKERKCLLSKVYLSSDESAGLL